jgi:nicotinate-nucleotide pyrophosphorylase (carboxylating)
VEAVAGTPATILDTRKTLPGLRLAQKYAVRCGGAENHRMGLYDAILVKENHIASAGGIKAAVAAASKHGNILIEVEVETLEQVAEALATDAHRLLLDNFSLKQLSEAVKLRDQSAPAITLEASGGISLGSVRKIAETGVDFISIGSLTKDVQAADLSMQFKFVE